MRLLCLIPGAALAATCALAQSSTTSYISDINGRTVQASSVDSSDHTQTERWQSINGQNVPLEQIEEHVIQEGPGGRTIERVVKKFSPTGGFASTERTIREERKAADALTVHETVWRSDINGNLQQAEQRTSETRGSGNNTSTETTIARPTINGGMQTVEKRSAVSNGTDAAWQSTETVYRLSGNGGMYEAQREVTESTKQNGRNTAATTSYEIGVSGALQFHSQKVSTTTTASDGRETTEVNLYARAADGIVQESGAPQQIKEQQIIERRKNTDGSLTETLSVRRPTISDPTHLGGLQQISETVCKGKCD